MENKERIVYSIEGKFDPSVQKAMAAIAQQSQKTEGAFKKAGNQFQKTTKNSQRFGYALQNTSYQVADFFVMLQGGISPMRALSTQLPQLLAGFGVFGAVLGAVAAVGASVVVMLQNQEKVVIDFGEALEEATDAQEKLNEATKNYVTEGGAFNRAIMESARAVSALKAQNLGESLRPPDIGLFKALWVEFLNDLKTINEFLAKTPYFIGLKFAIDGIAAGFELLGQVIGEFKQGVQEQLDLTDPIRKASEQFANLIAAAASGETYVAALTEEMRGFLAEGYKIVDLNVFGDFAADAGTKAGRLQALYAQAYATIKALGNDATEEQKEALEALRVSAEAAKEEFAEFAREYESLSDTNIYTELELQTQRYQRALDANIISQERFNELVAAAEFKDMVEPYQQAIIDIGKSFQDTIIDGLKEGKLAFEDFATYAIEQLARIALSKVLDPLFNSFANLIPSLFPGGGGGGGGGGGVIIGAGVGQIEPVFNPANQMARVEAPKPAYVGVISSNTPTVKGSTGITVNVNNYGNDDVQVEQRKTSRGVEIDVLIKGAVKQGIAQGDFDNVMRSSFGARRLAY